MWHMNMYIHLYTYDSYIWYMEIRFKMQGDTCFMKIEQLSRRLNLQIRLVA